jgi:phospho-N-acetylmuramoyl-pentapeptide-transferase
MAIILFTFISFAFLGVYDDLTKIFLWEKENFFGIRLRHKLIIEIILALLISFGLFYELKISLVNIPFLGYFNISYFYILFSTFVIISFANAVNITDGLDGLASGVLMIALLCFWVVARTIIDVPTSIFIAVWVGGLIAFLYFNIFPARIFLGDAGSFLQLMSKKYRGKKLFKAAPLHLLLQYYGWEEPKIVMRFWIISVVFAVIGLMIAYMK